MRPRLLDLFCGAGGTTRGYQRAGFYVVGVDHQPQPNYVGDEFIQADALDFLDQGGAAGFDAIHASPPCQAFSNARVIHGREHANLLTPIRTSLDSSALPWVIENVPGSPMRKDFVLCGSMFGLGDETGGLIRHRWFEVSWGPCISLVSPCQHRDRTVSVFGHGGHVYHGVGQWRRVMGIDWMTRDELAEAIPPAYTEHVGHFLLRAVQSSPPTEAEETAA